MLVDDTGSLAVDVVNQDNFQLSGKFILDSVGSNPPIGAVAALPSGTVFVTHTGAVANQQAVLSPSTEVCALATSQCDTVWSGWGSATAAVLDDGSVAVPAWDYTDETSGKLAVFGGTSFALRRQVSLVRSTAGAAAISHDGHYMYWLTYSPLTTGDVQLQLLRVDADNGNVDRTVKFGKSLPYAIAVEANGDVAVSLLYDRAPIPPSQTGGAPVAGVYGSTVEIFDSNLTPLRMIHVQTGPSMVASNASTLMVAAIGASPVSVGLYDSTSGQPLGAFSIPAGWTLTGLQTITLADGHAAGAVEMNQNGSDTFKLGIVSLPTGQVAWHQFSGQSLGSVAA